MNSKINILTKERITNLDIFLYFVINLKKIITKIVFIAIAD